MKCGCAKGFRVEICRLDQYERLKQLFNRGRHPGFIGRQTYQRCAENGGALAFVFENSDVAAALVNPRRNTLYALNVLPNHRGHGLGRAAMQYLAVNWVRATEERVPFFERLGFVSVGGLKKGVSLNTQVMVRKDLFQLAGKLRRVYLGET